jgi:hypothetical protein
MRRMSWLLLVLAGCAGSDGNPVKVAKRFHDARAAGDYGRIHALLTDADRAAVPLHTFPRALPPRLAGQVLVPRDARLQSVSLLSAERDTADVVLHIAGGATDTLRLVATHAARSLWLFELDRARWRIAAGLAERVLLDSLAAPMRAHAATAGIDGVDYAKAYLQVAERYPAIAQPADVDAARSLIRRATIAESLRVELRVLRSFTGSLFIEGRLENPTPTRIRTLRLIVQDEAGAEQRLDLWEIAADGSTPVRQSTRLGIGPLTYRLERIQVF